MAGEFLFVLGVLFGSLGVAVMVLGGTGPLHSGRGLTFFGAVLIIAARAPSLVLAPPGPRFESSATQKALRERRGF